MCGWPCGAPSSRHHNRPDFFGCLLKASRPVVYLGPMSHPPTVARQKDFIIENSQILDEKLKMAILRLVMMEVGKTATIDGVERPVVLENRTTRELSIDFDAIANPEVILHIYNIVDNRRRSLDEPAQSNTR